MGHSYRVRIGLREIQAMQPNTVLWDQEIKGFVARRQRSDVVTFSVVYRTMEGTQRWQKLARFPILTPHLARQEAIKILRAKALGLDPAGERMALRGGATIAELCDDYVADMDSHKLNGKKETTKKSDKSRIENHIRPRLGKLRVAAITQSQIESFMNECSPGSAKRIMQLTSAIFTFAINKGLRSDNPCSKVKKPPDNHKTRRLSEIEYVELWKAIGREPDPTVASVIKFLAISGWRSSEARLLKWEELDLQRQITTLADTKTGKSIRPLSVEAVKIIEAQPKNGPYVFEYKGKPMMNFAHHFRRLGLDKTITPHVLRHSYASLGADLGLADSTIARLLGHSQSSVTSRYIHMEKAVIEASNLVANDSIRLMKA
jgi:integrase